MKIWTLSKGPHSDPIINKHTEQVKNLHMDLSWHALNPRTQAETHIHIEKQGFGYLWLSKNIQTHPLKPAEAEPNSSSLQN